MSRFARQSQGFRVKGSIQIGDFCVKTSKQGKSATWTDSSNEFLTRSNVNQQRVSHSFRRPPRSFQIRSPTSLTLVPTSSALVPDSQLTIAIDRGQATHRAQRAPQQGSEEKNSTALRYSCLPCFCSVSCAQLFVHARTRRWAVRHIMIIVHVVLRLYTRCQRRLKKTESNKCSAVAMWMVRHKQIQKMMAESKCEPEELKGRIIFMSMNNDIEWTKRGNKENCIANSVKIRKYARQFPQRRWSFLVPGCEKKWYGTHLHKPEGEWEKLLKA